MKLTRRHLIVASLPLAGCTLRPLAPVRTQTKATTKELPLILTTSLGKSWTYQKFNGYNSQRLATERDEVVALTPHPVVRRRSDADPALQEEHHAAWGEVVADPCWGRVMHYEQPLPLWLAANTLGQRHLIRTHYRFAESDFRYWIDVQTVATGWETVHLTHGSYRTLRMEKYIRLQHEDPWRLATQRKDVLWLAPDIGRWVVREISGEFIIPGDLGSDGREDHFRWELTAWS